MMDIKDDGNGGERAASAAAAIRYDREMHIATASSRDAKRWRNETLMVSDFVSRISATVRTPETVEQYARMPKGEQDIIKDVGGFVGAVLKGGRRGKADVANRQMLTLDADYATAQTVATIRERLRDVCWSIYSTHKHTAERPRLRLIVYPDRALLPDEYQAAMRLIASRIGIDQFDDTTYDINRLMYWPSTPNDGEFFFEHNDAPFLAVDALLADYGAGELWRDATLWPQSSRETKRLGAVFERQADPLKKRGIVGAFCRVFAMSDALDQHLPDVYSRDAADRYTYSGGTTTKGLVVYDDKFCFSNHDSDPASGLTCNAFDIVRIHKFGHMDTDAPHGASGAKLPSFAAMVEWAREIKAVRLQLVEDGIDATADDFDEFDDDEVAEDDNDWLTQLQVTDDGAIKTTFLNAVLIVENDPKINRAMRFNEFSMMIENAISGDAWGAVDSYAVRCYVGRKYDCDFPEIKIEQAIERRAHARGYHPIKEYLDGLEWDGKQRVETFLIDYVGADDNTYTREAARCWFAAAVYRVFEPGHKFDAAIVLGGPQGIGKTSLIQALGLGQWAGELSSFDPKIAMEEISGKWIVEISEMGATNRHELEQQKAFLSGTETRVRPAYAKHAVTYKRQCVFMGTTNQSEYLKDSTGNRRWWPIECGESEIDLKALREAVPMLWAEAHYLYLMGEPVTLSREAREAAAVAQDVAREADPWEGVINEWLEREASVSRYDRATDFDDVSDTMWGTMETRQKVCIIEVWEDCLKGKGDLRLSDRKRIAAILDKNKSWCRRPTATFGERFGRQRGWMREAPF